MTRGTLKKPASSAGVRARSRAPSSRSSDGRTSSGRSAAWRVDDAGGRRDAGRVDLLHLVGVREDVAELAREQLDLVGVELEVRERGDRRDLRRGESAGMANASMAIGSDRVIAEMLRRSSRP